LKLSKAEIASITITVLFIIAAGTVSLIGQSSEASLTVSFEHEETPSGRALPSAGASSTAPEPESTPELLININTATAEELCSLPGIGEVLSEQIIAHRSEHGLFASIEDIMDVSGIGFAKYENIKNYITVQTNLQEARE